MRRHHVSPPNHILLDYPCTDDDCTREHVYLLTADDYQRINDAIADLDYGTYLDKGTGPYPHPDDYDWIADILT